MATEVKRIEFDATVDSKAATAANTGVGFITEVDVAKAPRRNEDGRPSSTGGKGGAHLPLISVYRVEDAELPMDGIGEDTMFAPLPETIPVEKVMTNIVNNLDFEGWSEKAKNTWFKDFCSKPSRAVISDTFWYCICWYFKSGQHTEVEKVLFDRISANYVTLFSTIPASRKDFFFRCYYDAISQAVLYSMFLAYPKSRVHFTEKFRKDLIIRIAYWTTGVCPEFVDTSHWKLNLGGGDVLQSTTTQIYPKEKTQGKSGFSTVSEPQKMSANVLLGHRESLAHRAPRPVKTLRYSPLVAHFLKSKKYSSVNLVRAVRMAMTTAEERSRLMDLKHEMLLGRAHQARQHSDQMIREYEDLCADLKRQEKQKMLQTKTAKKKLEIRRKEVLRSDPHEYANYLVSLNLLQQIGAGA
jgi:hypothetical protein